MYCVSKLPMRAFVTETGQCASLNSPHSKPASSARPQRGKSGVFFTWLILLPTACHITALALKAIKLYHSCTAILQSRVFSFFASEIVF